MRLASLGRHRPHRRTVLALIAGTLALAGCSDILGGGEEVPMEEVVVVDDDGSSFALAGNSGAATLHLAIEAGYTQHVTFRFNNQNGVPVTNPEVYTDPPKLVPVGGDHHPRNPGGGFFGATRW